MGAEMRVSEENSGRKEGVSHTELKMNRKFKNSSNDVKKPLKYPKEKMDVGALRVAQRDTSLRRSKERKLALQQEVERLRRKLRHEESVHRALERAFHRPLGVLPRLPPYLPHYTLELLAEVAVLEEEVVSLERQVVNFRQGLYQEAVHRSISSPAMFSSKKPSDNSGICLTNNLPTVYVKPVQSLSEGSTKATMGMETTKKNSLLRQSSVDSMSNQNGFSSKPLVLGKEAPNKVSCLNGKENQFLPKSNSSIQTPQRVPPASPSVKQASVDQRSTKKLEICIKRQVLPLGSDAPSGQLEKCTTNVNSVAEEEMKAPTELSEDLLKCLLRIFMKLGRISDRNDCQNISTISTSPSDASTGTDIGIDMDREEIRAVCDPYDICAEFRERDIGPYKNLCELSSSSIDLNRVSDAAPLVRRMKNNILQLQTVELRGLTHHQKLAFWINIYNSCMMNAFLEYGIPDSPQTIVALMRKAVLNIGGHILNALTIEHLILRLPYHLKPAQPKGGRKNDEATVRNVFGLDWPEPLVTFALACGSRSSPAVRIYTAMKVRDELEEAKRDYLQAAISISPRNNMLAIPKLLDWYLLDFAKDLNSLLDWIFLQLPNELRKEAAQCLERERNPPLSQAVQIMPYDFSFRYLIST